MNYELLSSLCMWNKPHLISDLLNESPNRVDILYDEGRFLKIAVDSNYTEVLNVLITYYRHNFLQGADSAPGESRLYEYIHRKNLLREAIEDAIDYTSSDISTDIDEIIREFMLDREGPDSYMVEISDTEDRYDPDIAETVDTDTAAIGSPYAAALMGHVPQEV